MSNASDPHSFSRSGKYFPPPPVWSLANVDGEPVLKPFHISKALPTVTSPGKLVYLLVVQNFTMLKLLSLYVEQEALAAAYRIHCNMEGGCIDGIEYTPYADSSSKENNGTNTSARSTPLMLHVTIILHLTLSTAIHIFPFQLVFRINMPYSSAQLINHPASGIQPNVHFYDFNWSQYLQYLKSIDPNANMDEEQKKIQKVYI